MIIEQYECGITGNSLIIQDDENKNVGYEFRMLTENNISGILNTSIRYINGIRQYVYDISSKVSLFSLYEHMEMKYEDLNMIILGMINGFEALSQYLMSENNLILNPKFIFIDVELRKVFMCYYPGHNIDLQSSLTELAEYVLQRTNHQDKLGTKLAYDFYKQILNGDFMFKNLISNVEGDTNTESNSLNVSANEVEDNAKTDLYQENYVGCKNTGRIPLSRKGKISIIISILLLITIISAFLIGVVYKSHLLLELFELIEVRVFACMLSALCILVPLLVIIKWINSNRANHNSDMVCNEDNYIYREITEVEHIGNTNKLVDSTVLRRLVQFSDEEVKELIINTNPYIIGKKSGLCNGLIKNEAVSRVHAKIIVEPNNGYYILDLNSKNGTYVNNVRLQSERVRLNMNDEIRFGNELFYFR